MRALLSVVLIVALVAPRASGAEETDAGIVSDAPVTLTTADAGVPEPRPKLAPTLSNTQRLAVLDAQLELEFRESAIWYFGWSSLWTAVTVGQFLSWPTDPAQRPSYWVWGIGSAVGSGLTWLLRPDVLVTRPELKKLREDETLSTDEKLKETERLWVRAHEDERIQRAWWQQLICVVTNLTPFLILGLGWKDWNWPYLALGLVLSEVQAFTFPQLLRRFGLD